MSAHSPYRVITSEGLLQQFRQWGEHAARLGLQEQYTTALRFIWDRLTNEPLSWGDPLFNLHQLDLLVLRGMHALLHVEYAVHQVRRVVFIRSLRLPPGSPLAGTPDDAG
jgi:hypothetical protein